MISLFPHQQEALQETKDFDNIAVYHDMGLGKTFTGSEMMKRFGCKVNLIVCQKSKVQDWVEHFTDNYQMQVFDLWNMKKICQELDRPISEINGHTKDLTAYEQESNSVTLCQYQSASKGLNLQKCNRIIYFSLPLSSEDFEQSKKRIHRIGQEKTCFYYLMICRGRVEVETAIKNTKDAVLISAKETATSYTDDKLKSYSTSAQIKVKTDSIESEVKKKLNSSELSTKIQQNASAVKIAWNNISKYVQFESGELRIYDSAVTSSQKLVSKFNYNGCHFYRNDYYVGKIGTNELQSDSSKKGLNFDLESNGAYMTWASKDSSSANVYTMKWTYVQKGKGWGNYTAGELHAGCNVDMHGWTLKNPSFEGGGINGTLNFVQILRMDSDGTVASWSNGCKMQFKNGILISGTWNG